MEQGEYRRLVAPLGVPTWLIADDPRLLAAAVAACPTSEHADSGNGIEIRLEIASTPSSNLSCRIEVEGSRIRVTGADFAGVAEADARSGRCLVPQRLVDDPQLLAAELLDPILLFLLTRSGRTPLHAAGIVINGTAVLLSGPGGSGKSSLAHAAARRGLPILSDDTVYVQLQPRLRFWGLPGPIHLLPGDAPPGDHGIRLRGGRSKAAVGVPPGGTRSNADQAILVLLERGGAVPVLTPMTPSDATAALAKLEPGFDLLPEQSAAVAEALVAAGAWKLTLSSRPDEAIDCLLAELPRHDP